MCYSEMPNKTSINRQVGRYAKSEVQDEGFFNLKRDTVG